jgi:hypothetical protein
MKTFGFSMAEPHDPPNYYIAGDNVSDDSVLFNWLVADNYQPSDEVGMLTVLAPEGYLFSDGTLVPISELTEEEVKSADDEDSDVWRDFDVRIPYRDADKAHYLREGVMRMVSPAKFYALGISEDRFLYFTID